MYLLCYIARKLLPGHLVSFLFQSTMQTRSTLLQQQLRDILDLASPWFKICMENYTQPKGNPNSQNIIIHGGRTGRTALLNTHSRFFGQG